MNLIWKTWWRSVDGEVSEDKGFAFKDDPDYFHFDIDPETQTEQISDDDPRRQHVDELFSTREAAVADTIKYLSSHVELYQRRLAALWEQMPHGTERFVEGESPDVFHGIAVCRAIGAHLASQDYLSVCCRCGRSTTSILD